MKIYGNKPPDSQDVNLKIQNINVTEAQKKVSVNTKKLTDKVDISSQGKDIAALIKTINEMPDIRLDKVEAIKKVIEAGNYKIDPTMIAEKILKEL